MRSRGRRGRTWLLGLTLLTALGGSSWVLAHEERLVTGRVQAVQLAANLLVVHDAERDRQVRLRVDAETEVQRCRQGLPVTALPPGARVRVKYLDRGTGTLETLSVLLLPGPTSQRRSP